MGKLRQEVRNVDDILSGDKASKSVYYNGMSSDNGRLKESVSVNVLNNQSRTKVVVVKHLNDVGAVQIVDISQEGCNKVKHTQNGNQCSDRYSMSVKTILESENMSLFSNGETRRLFTRRVLDIIWLQMATLTALVLLSVLSNSYRQFQSNNMWLIALCIVLNVLLLTLVYFHRKICRQKPINVCVLLLYTLSQSFLISFLCQIVDTYVLLLASFIVTFIVFSLSLYTYLSETDVTTQTSLLIYIPLAIIIILIVAGSFQIYMTNVIISLIIIGFIYAYLVIDLQRLTQKKPNIYTMEDFIIVPLDMYIDVFIIFKEIYSTIFKS